MALGITLRSWPTQECAHISADVWQVWRDPLPLITQYRPVPRSQPGKNVGQDGRSPLVSVHGDSLTALPRQRMAVAICAVESTVKYLSESSGTGRWSTTVVRSPAAKGREGGERRKNGESEECEDIITQLGEILEA